MTIAQGFTRIADCDAAQDIAEYAVLIAVLFIIVVATATALGTNAHSVFSRVGAALTRIAQ